MYIRYSYNSDLSRKILRKLRKPEYTQLINQPKKLLELQEIKIWYELSHLDDMLKQLNYQVNFLLQAKDYNEIVVAIKFYIIGWATLSDMLAKFINIAFDLGIDDKDLNITMVLRNSHIRETDLPQIIKSYSRKLQHGIYLKLRNDIVHRGILIDSDLEHIREQRDTFELTEMLKGIFSISDNQNHSSEFDNYMSDGKTRNINLSDEINCILKEYQTNKHSELAKHLADTVSMLDDIIKYISRRF